MNDFKTFEQWWEFVGSEVERFPGEPTEHHVQFVARLAFDDAKKSNLPIKGAANVFSLTDGVQTSLKAELTSMMSMTFKTAQSALMKHCHYAWEPKMLVYTPTPFDIEIANEERRKNTGQPLRNNDITSALSICQSVNNQITQMMRA